MPRSLFRKAAAAFRKPFIAQGQAKIVVTDIDQIGETVIEPEHDQNVGERADPDPRR